MMEQPIENQGELVPQDFVDAVVEAYNKESLTANVDGS